ncbi:hypothetical protein [Streptomyces sp. NPDC029674]|uniref:hypothetical protein n=1 Tax=Streptomyces sp. NPDC029674 TaxID=3365297 RepID=UPI0038501130
MSTDRRLARRPLLRAAAVSVLVGGALVVPAEGAFAESPTPRGEAFVVTLGNGAKAKVQNRGGSYAATVSLDGKEVAALSATRPAVTRGGVKYELQRTDGHVGITYVDHRKGQNGGGGQSDPVPQPRVGNPEGGVATGARGVRDAGDPAFLVAGGGMAAAGAAGLGFAMLRRGRTDA